MAVSILKCLVILFSVVPAAAECEGGAGKCAQNAWQAAHDELTLLQLTSATSDRRHRSEASASKQQAEPDPSWSSRISEFVFGKATPEEEQFPVMVPAPLVPAVYPAPPLVPEVLPPVVPAVYPAPPLVPAVYPAPPLVPAVYPAPPLYPGAVPVVPAVPPLVPLVPPLVPVVPPLVPAIVPLMADETKSTAKEAILKSTDEDSDTAPTSAADGYTVLKAMIADPSLAKQVGSLAQQEAKKKEQSAQKDVADAQAQMAGAKEEVEAAKKKEDITKTMAK